MKKIKEDYGIVDALAKRLKSENEVLRRVLEKETRAKNDALEIKNEYMDKLKDEKSHSGNISKIFSESQELKQTILTMSSEKHQAEELKKERDALEEKAKYTKEKKNLWKSLYQNSAERKRPGEPESPGTPASSAISPEGIINLSPITPIQHSPSPAKSAASPPKPGNDVEQIEEFATFGTTTEQFELIQVR